MLFWQSQASPWHLWRLSAAAAAAAAASSWYARGSCVGSQGFDSSIYIAEIVRHPLDVQELRNTNSITTSKTMKLSPRPRSSSMRGFRNYLFVVLHGREISSEEACVLPSLPHAFVPCHSAWPPAKAACPPLGQ